MNVLLTTLHSKYIHASLALPYLKAFCRDVCPDILIREYSVHEPKEVVLAQIVALDPDVVCFSVYLWNRLATLELLACIRLIKPETRIVLGGPEISFEEGDFFSEHPVDAVIRGEGELPLRHLLQAWSQQTDPLPFPGLQRPGQVPPPRNSLLDNLDSIPSPFQLGLVDLGKRLVYYESSRGCPYSCSFCMSSLDDRVRSFSMERIMVDLQILIDAKVPLVKFVDRTFNYDNARSREIFSYLVEHNVASQFHFEIGAHLLDDATLSLLEDVPDKTFQFEIGVQSTLPDTLARVSRRTSLERLADNVRRLKQTTGIHLHLDLIAGLPGEDYEQFLAALDWTAELGADHLQLEPVKLLPGAPLRQQAPGWGIRFDPNPPYTILHSDAMSFADLERLRGISRLMDVIVNSGRFTRVLAYLENLFGRLSLALECLDRFWRRRGLYRQSHSLKNTYLDMDAFLRNELAQAMVPVAREALARDYAMNERLMSGSAPDFFDLALSREEEVMVRARVKREIDLLPREGKVQYCAAVFHHQEDLPGRTVVIYLYLTRTGKGLQVREVPLL